MAPKTAYGYKRALSIPFTEALDKARTELQANGFGVLCEIDVAAKLKEKVGANIGRYVILGACNPPLAYRAICAERDIGLMFPCNIVISEKDSKVTASCILPTTAMGMIDNPKLREVAAEVEVQLKTIIDKL
ncbi:TPA: DUF302 domain-containing protein [Candidatus Woesearchaeota archaeon]|nr:DUF302 domain-containing protein [Candidatus Woesearchaeota archaeon]HII68977.1 DUF302 domain-containing protein [Candidatus Woesearchaeota archaeon]